MSIKIAQERSKTEFEIQAEALALLKEALGDGYLVRGEYHYHGCRFDLAIFRAADRELVCTIEIKKKQRKRDVRQTNKYYRATNKPCVLLTEATMRPAIAALRHRLLAS